MPTKGHQHPYAGQNHDPSHYRIARHVEGQADKADPSAEKDQTDRKNKPHHRSPPLHSANSKHLLARMRFLNLGDDLLALIAGLALEGAS